MKLNEFLAVPPHPQMPSADEFMGSPFRFLGPARGQIRHPRPVREATIVEPVKKTRPMIWDWG